MTSAPEVQFINPATIAPPHRYTHIAVVPGGQRLVYISGQVPFDSQGNIVGKGDFRAQTQQVFENLQAALEAVGATFHHVVKFTIYIIDMSQLSVLREIRNTFVNTRNPPTSTAIEVRRLAHEEFMIEIEAVAVLP
jgi:enamine deaminase RidA (YjgF/YER057c/UK114 family)